MRAGGCAGGVPGVLRIASARSGRAPTNALLSLPAGLRLLLAGVLLRLRDGLLLAPDQLVLPVGLGGVAALAAIDRVSLAVPDVELVVARSGVDPVGTGAIHHGVVAGARAERVVAGAAVELVGQRAAVEPVVARGSNEHIHV